MAATERPVPHQGLRHVALFVAAFEACERFYVEVLGKTGGVEAAARCYS